MPSMRFTPYKEVLGICFGTLEATIIEIHGKPERVGENRLGSKELIFPDKIFRLRPSDGALHEITIDSEYFQLEGREIGFADLGFFVAKHDLNSFEASGFVVSPKYGIAFDSHHNYFLTIFCEADLKEWEKLKA